ncbi:putative L-ascorbate peroxidase 6 isoform X3 [Elaeis guineensis]|uniref:putative L-ascorbate peroxidase 6 isoform X3 n=1 Tax=Elaeis guineensis var. tenera TaxID=51953 RepID=UPI00057B4FA0
MATATALLQSLGLSALCWHPSSLFWTGGTRRIRRRAIDGGRWRRDREPEPPYPRPFSSSLRCQCHGVEGLETESRRDSGGSKSTIGSGKGCFSSAYGRRNVILMAMVPLILPSHQIVEVVDSREVSVIQTGVRNVLSKTKAAGILRMAFHDAGTFDVNENSGGMNGSIIYELDRPENAGLGKSLKILQKVKKEIDQIQQVAGAVAILLCGGPEIPVRLGRLDARMPDPQGKLPRESFDASSLKRCFLEKGFSTQELVALSGAHTIGSKGFGDPNVFDNAYYKILLEKPWTSSAGMSSMIGLPSDRALVEDDECLRWIKIYAGDQVKFFDDFRNAYIKLVDSGALWEGA